MRSMTPATLAALNDPDVRPCLFYEGEFAGGFLRLWSGLQDMAWNAQTWVGAGHVIGLGSIDEGTDVVASGTVVTLAGMPSTLVSMVIDEAQQGLPGRIWIGFLQADGALIADPVQAFSGRLDVPQIADGADSCIVTVTYESRLIDLNTPREWRYTHESQKVLFPGDDGYAFVAGIQEKEITWGMPSPQTGSSGGPVAPGHASGVGGRDD